MSISERAGKIAGSAAGLLLILCAGTVRAAPTELASEPLGSAGAASIARPNIAVVLDDSASMARQNMPDEPAINYGRRCWGWYGYNTLFYNPGQTYLPPYKPDGVPYADGVPRYPAARFEAALYDGYFAAGADTFGGAGAPNRSVDLNSIASLALERESCYDCLRPQTRFYYAVPLGDPAGGSCEGDSAYRIVTAPNEIGAPGIPASGRSAEQVRAAKTNYANWFSYYRSRAGLIKASAAEAFREIDQDRYRIGLFFLNSADSGVDNARSMPNRDLPIANFSGSTAGTQRQAWFERLHGARAGSETPLRAALSRIGRMVAGSVPGWDPVQYSCQQNFAILSTDGYWNDASENASYGPRTLDNGAEVGDADAAPLAAAAASAILSLNRDFDSAACHYASSLQVKNGSVGTELLHAARVPAACPGNRDQFGQALRDSINARSAQSGYAASYSGGKLTIRAPAELGDFRATPRLSLVKVGSGGNATYSLDAFSGGVTARPGAARPYQDSLRVPNTLADVAYYYYHTDLRTTRCSNVIAGITYGNLCENNVRGTGTDLNGAQHLSTFTIGLGVNGNLLYQDDYENAVDIAGVIQYVDIASGTAAWPDPSASGRAKIDDLWHAAVNGHGRYYRATDTQSLKAGMRAALAGILQREGAGSAAAVSSQQPVAGGNQVFVASYRSVEWSGDLESYAMDPFSARLAASASWSAQALLDARLQAAGPAADDRRIWFFQLEAPSRLKEFTAANLNAAGLGAYFSGLCGRQPAPDQCGSDADDLDLAQRLLVNDAGNLVGWLRGQARHEDRPANAVPARLYRGRAHALGDIVNAIPAYAGASPFDYGRFDASHASFQAATRDRAATVYAAANDGMLHAFDAGSGAERWAYVPRAVMPNMWRLADRRYGSRHRYLLDGSPVLGDICASPDPKTPQLCQPGGWKTLLVGGLGAGGCAYYALDVSDPANPKGLWEFSHPQLGYSLGNPLIVKRVSGRWAVVFASGYNNHADNGCGSQGDGNGHLFVLDAQSGQLLLDIPTLDDSGKAVGSPAAPSGLAMLNAWIDDGANPVADRYYGADLLGNVWRFDIDQRHAPYQAAQRLARLQDGQGRPQPVTVRPELALARSPEGVLPLVLVGTGRYLGAGDLKDVQQQSLYALKDSLQARDMGVARGASMQARSLVQGQGTAGGTLAGRTIRSVAGQAMEWKQKNGWYLDLNPGNATPGERINTPMLLTGSMLSFVGNVPTVAACDAGGYAFLYFLDIGSGLAMSLATDGMAGVRLGSNALVAGISSYSSAPGKSVTIHVGVDASQGVETNPPRDAGDAGQVRRAAWRELGD